MLLIPDYPYASEVFEIYKKTRVIKFWWYLIYYQYLIHTVYFTVYFYSKYFEHMLNLNVISAGNIFYRIFIKFEIFSSILFWTFFRFAWSFFQFFRQFWTIISTGTHGIPAIVFAQFHIVLDDLTICTFHVPWQRFCSIIVDIG